MDVTAEMRLKRYLHYASELGMYTPGCRIHFKNYSPENVPSLYELLENGKEKMVIDIITKIYNEKTTAYPEAIIFVLAECVKQKESKIRQLAYNLVETVCTSCEHLFFFFKFAFEKTPKIGSGRAFKRLVKNWYLKKSALELAEIVALRPKYRGWKHSDILAITHISSKDPAKAAVFKFVTRGIGPAMEEYKDKPEANEVLRYLETVSTFRKLDDPQKAARAIECYMLAIDHVNFELLRDREVWIALLRGMPLSALLDQFQWLSKSGMFRNGTSWDFDFIKSICDAIGNPASISDSGLHPSRVYIELCRYFCAARMKLELAVKLHMKAAKQPPALSADLLKALDKLVKATFKLIEPSGLSYMVGVDVNETMQIRRCGHCPYVILSKAAALIILCLLRSGKSTDILAFSQSCLKPVTIPVESSVDETLNLLQQVQGGSAEVKNLFHYATSHKKKVDVFVVLTTIVKGPATVIVDELIKYRKKMDMPNARVILCNLNGVPKLYNSIEYSGILTVSGFDEKSCKIMDAFAKGAF